MTTSSKPGADNSGTPSMRGKSSRTKPPSSWMSVPNSSPQVLVTMKWVHPTPMMATEFRKTMTSLLMGCSKMTSSTFPGWLVTFHVEQSAPAGTTTRVVLLAEPDLPF